MAEKIFIADKHTLDGVKDDTQYIINKIDNPLSSLQVYTNIGKYDDDEVTEGFVSEHNYNDTKTFLNITGSGILNYILLHQVVKTYGLVIIIDGKNIIYGNSLPTWSYEQGFVLEYPTFDKTRDMPFRNLITLNIPFANSLKITGYEEDFGTIGYTLY